MADNRSYSYSKNSVSKRPEYGVVCSWIEKGSRVVDLGCGDGSLLKLLKDKKSADCVGVEVSVSGVESGRKKGIRSIQGRIDAKLPFADMEFDYSICNVTIQMVMYPEVLINEMKRVSKYQIVSFPNFAFFRNRIDLLINGRMPKEMIPGYEWYSTGHIHQFSIKDYLSFCKDNGLKILKEKYYFDENIKIIPLSVQNRFPNLFASAAIFLTTQK